MVKTQTTTDHKKEIISLIKQAAYTKDVAQVFNDFLEMAAISISNVADFTHRESREQRYLDIINSYDKKHQQLFPEMLAQLVLALDEKVHTTGPEDVLGLIFHELELHSVYKGQFFTPQHVSDFMAEITCGEDDYQGNINENGYITVLEPACGSGVMLTSFCKAMKKVQLNYCTQIVATAVDIDLKCAHMTYLQLSLYGVPAVVIHGDSLACTEWSRWYTPIYLLNGWIWREQCGITTKFCESDEQIKCALEPSYHAMRQIEALFPPPAAKIPEKVASKVITLPTAPYEFGEQISLLGEDS